MWYKKAQEDAEWRDGMPEVNSWPNDVNNLLNMNKNRTKFKVRHRPLEIDRNNAYKLSFEPPYDESTHRREKSLFHDDIILSPQGMIGEDGWATLAPDSGLSKNVDDIWEELPWDTRHTSKYLYRGMDADEYQNILETGYIQSLGKYNMSNQDGFTMFSVSPNQAANYAGNFAPTEHRPTFDLPGYIIKIRVPEKAMYANGKNIVGNEVAVEGAIPADLIEDVVKLVVYGYEPFSMYYKEDRYNPGAYESHGGDGGSGARYGYVSIGKPDIAGHKANNQY